MTQPTEHAARSLGANFVGEVDFSPGSFLLTAAAENEVLDLLDNLKGRKIKIVRIFAWSDTEYPRRNAKLPPRDVELARKRVQSIQNFVFRKTRSKTIFVYNMAVRPALEKGSTEEARFKSALEQLGAAPTDKKDTGLFGEKARSSSAIVLLYTD